MNAIYIYTELRVFRIMMKNIIQLSFNNFLSGMLYKKYHVIFTLLKIASINMKFKLICIAILTNLIIGCGGGDGEDSNSSIPDYGNSNIGVPSSLIGKTLKQIVTNNDGSQNVIGVGKSITYTFIDNKTILGEGLHTLPTTSWSYSKKINNQAEVELEYSVGWAKDVLTFQTPTTGTYRSETGLITGTKGWHEGTFVLENYDANTPLPPDNSTKAGQVSFWASSNSSPINITVENKPIGTITKYFPSGVPDCGSEGTVTITLPIGTHTYTAKNDKNSWGPSQVKIEEDTCTTLQLR